MSNIKYQIAKNLYGFHGFSPKSQTCHGSLFFVLLLLAFMAQGCSTHHILISPEYAQYDGEINQHRRFIRATSDRLFDMLTHEDAFRGICPEGTIVFHKPPLPYQKGTIVETRIEHIFKLAWNSRVEDILAGKKIRLRFLDGFFAGGTELWELAAVGEGTEIKHTVIVEPKGVLKQLAWQLKIRLKHDRMLEALLDNLEKKAENQ